MTVKVHAVLINPAGNLVQKTANGPGDEKLLKSALQIVALFIERSEDANGNPTSVLVQG